MHKKIHDYPLKQHCLAGLNSGQQNVIEYPSSKATPCVRFRKKKEIALYTEAHSIVNVVGGNLQLRASLVLVIPLKVVALGDYHQIKKMQL